MWERIKVTITYFRYATQNKYFLPKINILTKLIMCKLYSLGNMAWTKFSRKADEVQTKTRATSIPIPNTDFTYIDEYRNIHVKS